MQKKGLPEVFVGSVVYLYEGAETRVRVFSELSEEFEFQVGMRQGFVLSAFLFVNLVDIVTELVRDGMPSELLYV